MGKLRSVGSYVYVSGYGVGQIHGTNGRPATGMTRDVKFTEKLSGGVSVHKILTFADSDVVDASDAPATVQGA